MVDFSQTMIKVEIIFDFEVVKFNSLIGFHDNVCGVGMDMKRGCSAKIDPIGIIYLLVLERAPNKTIDIVSIESVQSLLFTTLFSCLHSLFYPVSG